MDLTKWFAPKYSVCKECGAHFEPVKGYEAQWGDLCGIHRKSVMELDQRRERVMSWARQNWERLEPQAKEEMDKMNAAYNKAFQSMAQAQMNQYNGQYATQNLFSNVLGMYK